MRALSPNARRAFGLLREKGYPVHVAAGLVGNMMQESGWGIDTKAVGDNGNAFGAVQWNGPRRRAYMQFAASRGVDPADLSAQIDFLDHELRSSEKGAREKLMAARDLDSATLTASKAFWRPGDPRNENRVRYARAVAHQALTGGGGSDTLAGGESPQPASPRPVTDPDILRQLQSGPKPVTDPDLLRQLNGAAETPTEQPSIWDKAREYGILNQGTEEIAEGIASGDLGQIGTGLGMAAKDVFVDTPGRALSALEGATLGHSGEIVGAVAPETGAAMDATREQFAAENPAQALVAEIGGAGAVTALPAGAAVRAVQGASLPTRAATMAGVAGAEGTVYGHGTGQGEILSPDRVENALFTGGISAATGMTLPFFGKAAQEIVTAAGNSRLRAHAPGIQDLRQAAGALFQRVEQSGIQVDPTSFGRLAIRMNDDLMRHGFHDKLTPKSKAALQEVLTLAASGKPPTLSDLKLLREVIGTAAEKTATTGKRDPWLARRMIDKLDDYIDNLKPADLAPGSAPVGRAAADYREARQLWGRMRRMEVVEEAIEKARNQASGFENGLRIQFRRIINSPKLRRGFSDEEMAVMKKVANGTVTRDALRLLSRFAFMRDGGSNALGFSIGAGAGAAVGGPVGALVAPMVGQAGSLASTALTSRAAQTARAMTATGPRPGPTVRALVEKRLLQLAGPSSAHTASQLQP